MLFFHMFHFTMLFTSWCICSDNILMSVFTTLIFLNLNPSARQILFFSLVRNSVRFHHHSSIMRPIPSFWQQQVPFKRFSILGVTANAIYIMVVRSSGSHRPPWRLEKPLLLWRRGGDSPNVFFHVRLLFHINHKDHSFHIVTLVFSIDQLGLHFTG